MVIAFYPKLSHLSFVEKQIFLNSPLILLVSEYVADIHLHI